MFVTYSNGLSVLEPGLFISLYFVPFQFEATSSDLFLSGLLGLYISVYYNPSERGYNKLDLCLLGMYGP